MAKWRVWNRHPNGLTHTEKFKEREISIKAGEYVLMDYEEAVQFRGQFFPMKKDAQGAPDPRGFKCIQIEKHDDQTDETKTSEFVCHFDGAKFPSQSLLDAYVKQNYSEHSFKDEAIEEEIKAEKKRTTKTTSVMKERTA